MHDMSKCRAMLVDRAAKVAVFAGSAVMRFALDGDELLFVSGVGEFVDESVRVIDKEASA